MKTIFLTLLFIGTVIISPLFFLSLSVRYTPITPERIKGEIMKLNLYDTAVSELQKQLNAMAEAGQSKDPFAIIEPFVKKEITPPYIREKAEKLIDDTSVWLSGGTASPAVSFVDLKEKLVKQNKKMIGDLEAAIAQISTNPDGTLPALGDGGENAGMSAPPTFTADDFRKFMGSDFTIPVGKYLGGLKFFLNAAWYTLIISGAVLALNLLMILLVAPGLQSKLRWMGATLLITALWNIPGALLGAGSAAMIVGVLTQNVRIFSAAMAKPLVETLITPVLLTYTRFTGGAVIALLIVAIGMIILSFVTKPVAVGITPSPVKAKNIKK